MLFAREFTTTPVNRWSHARQGVPRIWAVAHLSPVDLIAVELKTVELIIAGLIIVDLIIVKLIPQCTKLLSAGRPERGALGL